MSVEILEQHDNFAGLRNALRAIAAERGDWAGIPMPLSDTSLVIEPKYPRAKELMELFGEKPEPAPEGVKLRNVFWSTHRRCDIVVYEENGKAKYGIRPGMHSLDQQLQTLGASFAWGIEQEAKAIETLAGLVPHHTFKMYMLTGAFLESSPRSGLMYMFRRLRPTVAITPHKSKDRLQILCTLCLHPIAYYSGSWAGAMCPTDDVIAHLMLMRGDEPMFWRRANQHPAWRPESGL